MQPDAFRFQYWTDLTADDDAGRGEGGFTLPGNIHSQTIITHS